MTTEKTTAAEASSTEVARSEPTLRWDDSKMQTTYANAVNAAITREEVSLFFGTNQTWHLDESRRVTVQLSDRIVLNPYAAKRLSILLSRLIGDYEKRFGALPLDRPER